MTKITKEKLLQTLKDLIIKANTEIRLDIAEALSKAAELEEKENAKKALKILLENAEIAQEEKLPICQDTGYVDIFFELPASNVILSASEESNLQAIADGAVSQVYSEQNYRFSMVGDPLFKRKNTGNNTPANINVAHGKDDQLKITVLIKGAGSDNSSALFMLNPSTSEEDVIKQVVGHIKENGPKSCPPLVIGIGIGSSFDKVGLLSKKALLKPIGRRSSVVGRRGLDTKYSELEQKLLREINNLGIGPSALGGKTTALAVQIEQAPCHMATLPLAINLNCYALRSASISIGGENS